MAASMLLISSIPTGKPSARVSPFSRAAPCRKVTPVARVSSPVTTEQPLTTTSPRTLEIPTDTNGVAIAYPDEAILPLKRSDFPPGFIFGTATSAYQIEGAADSRGKSAWDHFTRTYPDKIAKGHDGETACDSCRLYMDDIRLMKEMNADAYRFSISWSRILPTGKKSEISQAGIDHYNDVIDALLLNNIKPYVTLLHVDRPQSLEEEYKGFLSSKMIEDFKDFADICFENFGDRVKNWITLNEPRVYCALGYSNGLMAPARCSSWQQDCGCIAGDSGTEPYTVGHNLLLAHSAVVDLYKTKYQGKQDGKIGISFDSTWFVPSSDSKKDQKAAERALDFHLGWFLEPLKSGDYPDSMKELVGSRLPKFDDSEWAKKLKGSYDFIGLNYYTSQFASDVPDVTSPCSYVTDHHCKLDYMRGDTPIGLASASGMYVYPKGLRDLLCYVKKNYNDPEIYITENGYADLDDPVVPIEEACMDINRIDYIYKHLYHLHSAITKDEVNVKGYFAWSLLDNFEWSNGYNLRFGFHYTDYSNLKRFPKYSARWFKQFLSQ